MTLAAPAEAFTHLHVASSYSLRYGTATPRALAARAADLGMPALVAACAYVFSFGVSWGPIVWVLLGEMFPNQMRGAALAVSGLSQWGANFLITMTFPILLDKIGLGGAYGLYAFFAFISIFIVMGIVKETKGRTLEQMTS